MLLRSVNSFWYVKPSVFLVTLALSPVPRQLLEMNGSNLLLYLHVETEWDYVTVPKSLKQFCSGSQVYGTAGEQLSITGMDWAFTHRSQETAGAQLFGDIWELNNSFIESYSLVPREYEPKNYHGERSVRFFLAGAVYFKCKQVLEPSASTSLVTCTLLQHANCLHS